MTRINVVPVEELCDQHLLAEWRELPRMRAFANKAVATERDIPSEYKLGEGHMTFFLNKRDYLETRHAQLTNELLSRGFNLNNLLPFEMSDRYSNVDYTPVEQDLIINRARIAERIPTNARWSNK